MSVHVLLKDEAVEKCAKAIAGVHNQDWKLRTKEAEELVAALVALQVLKLDTSPRG
jgi:hypothetical protein